MQIESNPRKKRRRKARYCIRRRRGGKRSWRAFVRKHKRVMSRLGLKRGIRKIAKMWKRIR